MITHQVYFWLKDPENPEAMQELLTGLYSLLTIDTIKAGHLGFPAATPAREVVDHSFSVAYYTTFASLEDHEIYQNHPVHLKFVEDCQHLWSKVQVYDYSLAE